MARSRNIKPGFFVNDELAECPPLARLMFIGLWTLADAEGRLKDKPKQIKAQTLPYDECDPDSLLINLEQSGFIQRYIVLGQPTIQVVNFVAHQNPHINERKKGSVFGSFDDRDNSCEEKQQATEESSKIEINPDKSDTNRDESLLPITESLNPLTESGGTKDEPQLSGKQDDVDIVFSYWQTVFNHKRAILDADRKKDIKAALKIGRTVEDIKLAIDGCSVTPHNIGQNDRGQVYDGLHIILSNKNFDRFVQSAESPPTGKKDSHQFDQSNYGETEIPSWMS